MVALYDRGSKEPLYHQWWQRKKENKQVSQHKDMAPMNLGPPIQSTS